MQVLDEERYPRERPAKTPRRGGASALIERLRHEVQRRVDRRGARDRRFEQLRRTDLPRRYQRGLTKRVIGEQIVHRRVP